MGERFPAQSTRFRSFNSAEGEAGGGDSDSAERTELNRRVSLQHHVGIRGDYLLRIRDPSSQIAVKSVKHSPA